MKLGKSLVGEHYVIPFDDLGAFHKTSAQKRFAQIEKLAGVKHLGMHALRHTHVSNLVAAHQKINSIFLMNRSIDGILRFRIKEIS